MEWQDEGIVLGGRRFGEAGLIVDVFTPGHGKRSGLVYGGAGRKKRAGLEPGNRLDLEWRGRTGEQLGHFSVADVADQLSARLLHRPAALAAIASATALMRMSLAESQPFLPLYEATSVLLGVLEDDEVWPAIYVRWEMALLTTLGFGIDLSSCAVSGVTDGLTHVSPRSGRGVVGSAAPEFVDRLLPLPGFLAGTASTADPEEVGEGLDLTGYFLERRVFTELQTPPPDTRDTLLQRMDATGLASFR